MTDFIGKVAKYKGQGFTNGQEVGIERLTAWYNNPKELDFTLSGRAGTGKTYMLKYFLDEIVKQPVCVSAPTHKAVRQVERSTGRKGKTLQSLHALRPNVNLEDFDLNNVKFDALGNPTMNNYKIIIIDECSMINEGLHELNMKRAKDLNVKILYVGDIMQLPPVNRNDSVSSVESPTFKIKNYFELDEIVRQGIDNPLTYLLETIVNDIKTNGQYFITFLKNNPYKINSQGEGYRVYTNHSDFLESAIQTFVNEKFSNDPDYARVAAWKNNTVQNYNMAIRNKLIPLFTGEGAEKELIDINDLLIGYKTIIDEFNETVIVNSEDYVIDSIIPREAESGFKSYAVKIRPRHGGRAVNVNIVDYRDKSFMVYYEKIKSLYFKAKYAHYSDRSKRWKEYFEYKDMHLSIITFPIRSGEEIKGYVSKDIDYAFALTVHKLQGSTIENTFVDLNDMLFYSTGKFVQNSSYDPNATMIRNKLIYTALSRTSKFANIYLNI